MKRSKTMAGKVCLHFAVNMKVERQTTEIQRKGVFGSIIDRRVCRTKRVFDLFNRRQNFRRVEMKSAVPQANKFHIEDFDGLKSLRDRIENQSQSTQRQINNKITTQRILKVIKTKKIQSTNNNKFFGIFQPVRCTKSEHS